MKILFASIEVAPFSKAGGLADVVGSLPKELVKEKDVEIAIFTALHGCVDKNKYSIKELEHSTFRISFNGCVHEFRLFMTKLPGTNINVFFIDCPFFFGCFNEVYPKWLFDDYENQRYVCFSQAILEYAKMLNFKPDIIHANDWHTAMIPAYLKSNYNMDPFYENTKTVFSIHNLAHQGVIDPWILDFANMQKHLVYHHLGLEHFGKVNWMKGAINFSDKIVVVSPKYASEILTGEFGEGMDFTLRGASNKIVGILNGIDQDVFNSETDTNLVKNYSFSTLENKIENKIEILRRFGLEYDPCRPLFATVSRMVKQKGFDLVRDMQYELQKRNIDYIILGSGDKDFENLSIWLSNNTKNIRSMVGYDEGLAHLLYSGADFLLMPSLFEPCGLSQLIALRYGTLPVVRAIGGLEDTVTGYPLNGANGFKFWRFNGYDMMQAIDCAIGVYNDKNTFKVLIKNAMSADHSWKKSAKEYMKMYNQLCLHKELVLV